MSPNARAILHNWNTNIRDRLANDRELNKDQVLWSLKTGAVIGAVILVTVLIVLVCSRVY